MTNPDIIFAPVVTEKKCYECIKGNFTPLK